MPQTKLASINLNLLVALDALLAEAHVGRAADRAGVTQSAMSQSLKQLRELYGDPLLVRGRQGMCLTPRAQEIALELHRGLGALENTLAAPEFDTAKADCVFSVAMGDALALAIVPPLLQVFRERAPNVELRVLPIEQRIHLRTAHLESGHIDLLFGAGIDDAPELRRASLHQGGFVGLARSGNVVPPAPSLEEYAAQSHVVYTLASGGFNFVDDALAAAGLKRRVVLRSSFLLLCAQIVAETDHVMLARKNVAPALVKRLPLRAFEAPVPTPVLDLQMLWHERFEHHAAHRWLRAAVLETAGSAA